MKNKILFLAIGLCLTAGSALAFSDVSENHRYQKAVQYMQENDIVEGYTDGSFKPDNQINRAELLKIIIESKFSDEEITSALNEYKSKNYWYADLPDVDINAWYAPYVRIGVREGIVRGYPDNTFRPENSVNFVEALKMMLKAYNIEYNEQIQPWFRGSVEKAAELNLNPLDITSFDLNITRAQMAEMISRTIKQQEGKLDEYLGERAGMKQTYTDIINGQNKFENEDDGDEASDIPQINFSSSKDSFKLGEDVDVEYSISYSGEPMDMVQLVVGSREGYDEKIQSKLRFETAKGQSIDVIALSPFSIEENGYSLEDNFKEEGTYVYTVSIFDCSKVPTTEEESCFEKISKNTDVEPIASASKSIEIISAEGTTEEDSDNCGIDEECFEEHFIACTPGTYSFDASGIMVEYYITTDGDICTLDMMIDNGSGEESSKCEFPIEDISEKGLTMDSINEPEIVLEYCSGAIKESAEVESSERAEEMVPEIEEPEEPEEPQEPEEPEEPQEPEEGTPIEEEEPYSGEEI